MNALEKCLDMLIAIAIMFLLPLLFYHGGYRIVRSVSAGVACENFLKRVCTTGEINYPVWKELADSLGRFGCEKFGVRREYILWEPGAEKGSVVEQRYREENDAILEDIRTEGIAVLHKGDSLQVIFYMDNIPTVYYDIVRSEGKAE